MEVRNTAVTSVGPGYLWTMRRTYPLLGHSLPERQVSDMLAAAAILRSQESNGSLAIYGKAHTAPLAIYSAILDNEIQEIVLDACPTSHTDPDSPEFLGVLRIGDLPHNLALAYPRPITFVGKIPNEFEWTRQLYQRFGKGDRIRTIDHISQWHPTDTAD